MRIIIHSILLLACAFVCSCSRSLTDIGYKTALGSSGPESTSSAQMPSVLLDNPPAGMQIVTISEFDYGHYAYITGEDVTAFRAAVIRSNIRTLRDFYRQLAVNSQDSACNIQAYKPLFAKEIIDAVGAGNINKHLFLPNGASGRAEDLTVTYLGNDRYSIKDERGADSVVLEMKFRGREFLPVITALNNPSLETDINATATGVRGKGYKDAERYSNVLRDEYMRRLGGHIYGYAKANGSAANGLVGDGDILSYGRNLDGRQRRFVSDFCRSLNAANASASRLSRKYQKRCSAAIGKAVKDYKRKEDKAGDSGTLGGWAMFTSTDKTPSSQPAITPAGKGWFRIGGKDEGDAVYILVANTLDHDKPVIVGLVNKKREAILTPGRK